MTVKEIKLQKKLVGIYKQCIKIAKFDYKWWINPDRDYEELTLLSRMNVIRPGKDKNKPNKPGWNINTIRTKSFNKANKQFIKNTELRLNKANNQLSAQINSKSKIAS